MTAKKQSQSDADKKTSSGQGSTEMPKGPRPVLDANRVLKESEQPKIKPDSNKKS